MAQNRSYYNSKGRQADIEQSYQMIQAKSVASLNMTQSRDSASGFATVKLPRDDKNVGRHWDQIFKRG